MCDLKKEFKEKNNLLDIYSKDLLSCENYISELIHVDKENSKLRIGFNKLSGGGEFVIEHSIKNLFLTCFVLNIHIQLINNEIKFKIDQKFSDHAHNSLDFFEIISNIQIKIIDKLKITNQESFKDTITKYHNTSRDIDTLKKEIKLLENQIFAEENKEKIKKINNLLPAKGEFCLNTFLCNHYNIPLNNEKPSRKDISLLKEKMNNNKVDSFQFITKEFIKDKVKFSTFILYVSNNGEHYLSEKKDYSAKITLNEFISKKSINEILKNHISFKNKSLDLKTALSLDFLKFEKEHMYSSMDINDFCESIKHLSVKHNLEYF